MTRFPHTTAMALVLLAGCAPSMPLVVDPLTPEARALEAIESFTETCTGRTCLAQLATGTELQSFEIDGDVLTVRFNDAFAQRPFREQTLRDMESDVLNRLGPDTGIGHVQFEALGMPARELIPNAFRSETALDSSRDDPDWTPRPLLRRPSRSHPSRGLYGRHIALWASHGWYWERSLDRWEWQRARLFTTVEDVFPTSFVLPYLAPMLERAGAQVWMPRERDPQSHLLIADAEGSLGPSKATVGDAWQYAPHPGFGVGTLPYGAEDRPFSQGRFHQASSTQSRRGPEDRIAWTFSVPETGEYSVQIAYGPHPSAAPDAEYIIQYAGGRDTVLVDQRMGAGTWVWVGSYTFQPDEPAVVSLSRYAGSGTWVTADAVRLGGGTGIVERGGTTSGRPRWTEGARYNMQFSGMPDRLVFNVTESSNDYVDDYRGRGEWVNYLRGAPFGPNKERSTPGLNVPVDLSLAFHTDAGIAQGDTTIGTLMIYSSSGADTARVFPNGRSRFANRDFADILQTQIVQDIRQLFDPDWTRRAIWDRDYSEAVRPNVPAALLELLSHQNFADMRLGLDPRFRFAVSRAIYKAMLRYLSGSTGQPEPVIQPLRPDHVQARWTPAGTVRVSWRPVEDPLEPSASPERYRVQRRLGSGGFDAGVLVRDTVAVFDAPGVGEVVSYRIVAENDGGSSRPSEVVAIGGSYRQPRVLIISAFDRVGPPAVVDQGPWRGFVDLVDQGVPDGYDLGFVGAQHEFDAAVPWKDDDDPGHGASFANWEGRRLPGNTLDFAAMHGTAILAAGFAFETVSDESFERLRPSPLGYAAADMILGEESSQVPGLPASPEFAAFPKPMREALTAWSAGGGALFVSGAHVGGELEVQGEDGVTFGSDILGIQHRANRASHTGSVVNLKGDVLQYYAERNEYMYNAESPDAIDPKGEGARTVLRYRESNMSAGVARKENSPVVVWGFPFETLTTERQRASEMAAILRFLTDNP